LYRYASGTTVPCFGEWNHGCVLDPTQRRYRLVASPRATTATVTAVARTPGAIVHVFDGPPEVSNGALMPPDAVRRLGLEGAAPPALSTAVQLARVEARAPSAGAAAIYVAVTSPDGTKRWFYTVVGYGLHNCETAPGFW
jgi:hypothetical protein